MLRTGEATELGLCARAAGLSGRRMAGLWSPSRSLTTSRISSSMAASREAMVAVRGKAGARRVRENTVVGARSRAGGEAGMAGDKVGNKRAVERSRVRGVAGGGWR